MAASDAQVQQYVNERLRVRAEQFRDLVNSCRDDMAAIGDVFDACSPPESATWQDTRPDGPPALLTAQDVLLYNTMLFMFLALVDQELTDGNKGDFGFNWETFQRACVRPVGT